MAFYGTYVPNLFTTRPRALGYRHLWAAVSVLPGAFTYTFWLQFSGAGTREWNCPPRSQLSLGCRTVGLPYVPWGVGSYRVRDSPMTFLPSVGCLSTSFVMSQSCFFPFLKSQAC